MSFRITMFIRLWVATKGFKTPDSKPPLVRYSAGTAQEALGDGTTMGPEETACDVLEEMTSGEALRDCVVEEAVSETAVEEVLTAD